jgi:transposase
MSRWRVCNHSFPRAIGRPRVDDRRVLSGIVIVNRNGLRWCDAPKDYGPHKTLYNRWKRWGERGVFLRMMEGLAAAQAVPKTVMIDATYLKANRTAPGLRVKKRGSRPPDRPHERRHEHQIARHQRCGWAALKRLHDRRAGQRLHRRGSLARRSAESAVAAWRPRL